VLWGKCGVLLFCSLSLKLSNSQTLKLSNSQTLSLSNSLELSCILFSSSLFAYFFFSFSSWVLFFVF
jgi:hypothetical protein